MDSSNNANIGLAIQDFRKARQRAAMKEILARLRGEPTQLLSYEEVRKRLRAQSGVPRGLREIPLDAIIGSVNRYNDFTRDFLPRANVQAGRWARVEVATTSAAGVPPIEVYQIGEVYFVKDGNHRVSVARQFGSPTIQAYVTEIKSRVPLTSEVRAEDLIIMSEYADFLERTRLDKLRPEANLSVTVPGQYPILEEHIAIHRYYMGLEQQRDISYQEAVEHWYDTVYLPITQIIWSKGILTDFPGRTETDLYLWIGEHRAEIEKELGREIRPEDAVSDLANKYSPRPERRVARWGNKLIGSILPGPLDTGPSTGQWRREKEALSRNQLFSDILVAISGSEGGWQALEQALEIARRESGRLQGLYIKPVADEQEDKDKFEELARSLEAHFFQRCQETGIDGKMTILQGEVSKNISEQARWNDLVVVNLAHPPGKTPLAMLSSGFRSLVQRCPRPILAIPTGACIEENGSNTRCLNNALLAFDGSPKANEALFISAYLAGKWKIPLAVVAVLENSSVNHDTLDSARHYLDARQVEAKYLAISGPVVESILQTAGELNSDLLLLGGYGQGALRDIVMGSTVDRLLRASSQPMLISR